MSIQSSIGLTLVFALISCVFFLPTNASGQSSQNSSSACLYFVTQQNCPPCRQMDPVIEGLVNQGYPVKTVHLENNGAWAQWANVRSTPTVVMLDGNDRIVKRFSGVVGNDVLQSWFANAGVRPAVLKQNRLPQKITRHFDSPNKSKQSEAGGITSRDPNQGTSIPQNSYEKLALGSTVKLGLNVASQPYVDFASGTSIYSNGETSLILTCGHLFRDSNGAGQISVIVSGGDGAIREFAGTLLEWDASNRDIALVSVHHPGVEFPVNPIAPRATQEFESENLFTVGCDLSNRSTLGETHVGVRETGPTIRQTKILRRSKYDGIYKFDILGSPVQGRSGGGLFTKNGKLIGVCNARICDADEGIYTGLDSVYWVIEKAGLGHLFDSKVPADRFDNYVLANGKASANLSASFRDGGGFQEVLVEQEPFAPSQGRLKQVSWGNSGSKVIIIIENESGESELIRVENPTSELLGSVRAFKESRQQALNSRSEITSSRAVELSNSEGR